MRKHREVCKTCSRIAEKLGLCSRCYQAARRAIRSGKVTSEQLQEAGLIAKANTTPRSNFGSMLSEYLSGKRRRGTCQGSNERKLA